MKPKPSRITVNNSRGVLLILWNDKSECEYPFVTLRAACPCAECRESQKSFRDGDHFDELEIPMLSIQASELERLEMIGNYALQLIWKDGHSFGIYPWDYLRELCPQGNDPKESG